MEMVSEGEFRSAVRPMEVVIKITPTVSLTNALPYYMEGYLVTVAHEGAAAAASAPASRAREDEPLAGGGGGLQHQPAPTAQPHQPGGPAQPHARGGRAGGSSGVGGVAHFRRMSIVGFLNTHHSVEVAEPEAAAIGPEVKTQRYYLEIVNSFLQLASHLKRQVGLGGD